MSNLYTFRGGALVPSYSTARDISISTPDAPDTVELPVAAEGADYTLTVKEGDGVFCGQLIAECEGDVRVYSSVSGEVNGFSVCKDIHGRTFNSIIISNDKKHTPSEECVPHSKKLSETTPDEIIEKVRRLSITTDGGVALFSVLQKGANSTRRFILNAASDGAYSTVNYRLSIDKASDVISGAKIIMRALGVVNTDVVFGEDDTDAANALSESVGKSNLFTFHMLKMKYPRTHEKLLVSALTGRELSYPLTALDAGYVIVTPRVCADVFAAFAKGMPPVNCYVGVDGDASTYQRTLCVPRGTSYRHIIDVCGGPSSDGAIISVGGGLVGDVVTDYDAPHLLPAAELIVSTPKPDESGECINCGRCAAACPMRLMPMLLMLNSRKKKYQRAKRQGLYECIECGACSFVCPERLPVSRLIAEAKGALEEKADSPLAEENKEVASDE